MLSINSKVFVEKRQGIVIAEGLADVQQRIRSIRLKALLE
jgi:hypothetical protein